MLIRPAFRLRLFAFRLRQAALATSLSSKGCGTFAAGELLPYLALACAALACAPSFADAWCRADPLSTLLALGNRAAPWSGAGGLQKFAAAAACAACGCACFFAAIATHARARLAHPAAGPALVACAAVFFALPELAFSPKIRFACQPSPAFCCILQWAGGCGAAFCASLCAWHRACLRIFGHLAVDELERQACALRSAAERCSIAEASAPAASKPRSRRAGL